MLKEIAVLSDRVVVMSERGGNCLQKVFEVAPEKIDMIPHDIPDLPFVDPSFHNDLFGVEGQPIRA